MKVSGPLFRAGAPRPSRIGMRLFAFNLLVLFVPAAGIFYLDVYEDRLLEAQERGMVQQARLAAAALATGPGLDEHRSTAMLAAIEEQSEARIRVFDASGRLLADTARFGRRAQSPAGEEYIRIGERRSRFLYQVGVRIVRVRDAVLGTLARMFPWSPGTPGEVPAGGMPVELRAALDGRYGSAVRRTPGQRSLTLLSAVPVRRDGRVIGAVVVSQSTFRILQALYEVRLRLFQIVLLSVGVAAVLTRISSSTIVNPIVRLARTAAALTARQTGLSGRFARVDRKDEVGDLARNLEALAARLDGHIELLESFAADVAHEFKNPLAAIRTAAETIADAGTIEERQRFLAMLLQDVGRLERLVDGVRELARIDAQLSGQGREEIELGEILQMVVQGRRAARPDELRVSVPAEPMVIHGSGDRLLQVFDNLIDNATGLSPEGSPVEITATVVDGRCQVSVADRGPGIPAAHIDRVFDRFFSYRPGADRRAHMGLGLAIAKAIVTGYGGEISARNRDGGGAVFDVRLPLARSRRRAASVDQHRAVASE